MILMEIDQSVIVLIARETLYGGETGNGGESIGFLTKSGKVITIPNASPTYSTWPTHMFSRDYLRLFKSPKFIIIFLLALISRGGAFGDVVTDYMQIFEFWVGANLISCGLSNIVTANMMINASNLTNMTRNATVNHEKSILAPKEPFWFAITLIAVCMPPVICLIRYSTEDIETHFLRHQFQLVLDTNESTNTEGRITFGFWRRFFEKIGMFFVLPFLILIRQLRQLLLILKIEFLDQTLLESLKKASILTRIKKFLTKENLVSLVKSMYPLSLEDRKLQEERSKTEKENELQLVKAIHGVLSSPDYEPPIRVELVDQLTILSGDRHDEAVLETTPQSVLNLSIMLRHGIKPLKMISYTFSFYSLVSSTAAYVSDKLKRNPVKRELNGLGKVLSFFAKFPSTWARCVLLSVLYSTQNFEVKLGFTLFLIVYVICAMFVEYSNLESDSRTMSRQLALQLFIRGYTSIFDLMEYKLKRCTKDGRILDEADIEAKNGKYEEPESRFRNQVMYLLINGVINFTFAIWFYYHSGEQICAIGFVGNPRLICALLMMAGAPISLFFTVIMNYDTVRKYATEIGDKAIEALNTHIRSTIEKSNTEEFGKLGKMFRGLSERERERVAFAKPPNRFSTLYCILKHELTYQTTFGLSLQLAGPDFPIHKDLEQMIEDKKKFPKSPGAEHRPLTFHEAFYFHIKSTIKDGDVDDVRRMKYLLDILPEKDKNEIIEMDATSDTTKTSDKSTLTYALKCDIENKLDLEITALFLSLGFSAQQDIHALFKPSRTFRVLKSPNDERWMPSSSSWGNISNEKLADFINELPSVSLSLFPIPEDVQSRTGANGNVSVKTDRDVVYIMGGMDIDMKTVVTYDIATKQFTTIPTTGDVPPALRSPSCAQCGDHLYVFGGENSDDERTNNMYTFNFVTHIWSKQQQQGDAPPPRYCHTSWCWGGSIYVFGGLLKGDKFDNNTYLFNPTTNHWKHVTLNGTSPTPRYRVATCVHGDVAYMYGGHGDGGHSNELYSLHMTTLTWAPITTQGATLLEVVGCAICAHGNNLFVLGGDGGGHSTLYCINLTTHFVVELLTLPSLLTGEQKEGEWYGIANHHMYVVSGEDGGSRVVVVGGRWGGGPSKFIAECDITHL